MGEGKAVLVTGASTGIGRKITERLAAEGHFVYAGARKDADLRALEVIRNVQALRLDVTNSHDIAAAVDAVLNGGRGLHGLVNNAGVFTLGPVIGGDDEEFDLVMAVNVRAVYRITKAFAPLVIRARGRIIMLGSLQGILAAENASAYSMSKHAIESFTDSLAKELAPLGVHVSVIEPGSYSTEIANNAASRIGANTQLSAFSQYPEPDDVAAAIALALFEQIPKRRYLVVPNEEEVKKTIKKQIEQLVQLNEGHFYTYNRSALVKMLDEALGNSRPRSGR
jgi:NAD(P)-dependent dehydrogenase (short-subunit alcohol dehydrogenase family)